MDKVDELLESENQEKEREPPKKRRRLEKSLTISSKEEEDEQVEEEGAYVEFKTTKEDRDRLARRELKLLLKKHKHLDLDKLMEGHHFVHSLDREQMHELLENVKLEVGMISPAQNAKNILMVVAGVLKLATGKDHSEKLTNDTELLSALEHYLPDPLNVMSIPLQFFSRIGYHILNTTLFGEDV
jgi:hypothetical protein